MKLVFAAIVCTVACTHASAQYYLRGAVYDASGRGIYNVKINLKSRGSFPFFSGSSGAFGIPVSQATDSILLQADGYETLYTAADVRRFNEFTLQLTTGSSTVAKHKLASEIFRKNRSETLHEYYDGGESYANLMENDFTDADKYPETGFALSINRASYSNVRRFINNGMQPMKDAVRIEEMLNYFSLAADTVKNYSGKFICSTALTDAPWNNAHQLLFIQLHAPDIHLENAPPANLVFLMDISGSMDQPNRLPLVKEAFKMLLNQLRAQDTVAIVIYGSTVATYLPPISGKEKDSIRNMINRLEAGCETPGEAALRAAYKVAEKMFHTNATNRIILCTDGDFNVGETSDKALEELVVAHRNSGIYLTCLGIGMGNYKNSKLEALAKKGNGNFAYIDNINEAEKILMSEFAKTLYSVADDAVVKLQFNAEYVVQYRLLGYDNKIDFLEDSTSELEGGEVGAGHRLTAVFEIESWQSNTGNPFLPDTTEEIAHCILQYKQPANSMQTQQDFSAVNNYMSFAEATPSLRFAASVIMFGGLLKQSERWKNLRWADVIKIASAAADKKDFAQNEFITIAQKAKQIFEPQVKKKSKKHKQPVEKD